MSQQQQPHFLQAPCGCLYLTPTIKLYSCRDEEFGWWNLKVQIRPDLTPATVEQTIDMKNFLERSVRNGRRFLDIQNTFADIARP